MFNPQRKSRITQIFLQEKKLRVHKEKLNHIMSSRSVERLRNNDEQMKMIYSSRLQKNKQEVHNRLNQHLSNQNKKIFSRISHIQQKKVQKMQFTIAPPPPHKHHNSYYTNIKSMDKIKNDNHKMNTRVANQSGLLPSFKQLDNQFKVYMEYAKIRRKLPSILKYQKEARKETSQKMREKITTPQSKSSLRSSRSKSSQKMKDLSKLQKSLLVK